MPQTIGIDLGTTNSVVAFLRDGDVTVIPNSEGSNTTPSVVYYREASEPIVGELAKRRILTEPLNTIRSIKRFIGLRASEADDKKDEVSYSFTILENDILAVDMAFAKKPPEEVSADILFKMKTTAEDFLNESVQQAVITVPAHFNDSQRQSTKHAAELAGLEVLRIINEPTAACLAYGLNKEKVEKVAVFDFGGGTFDISILELDQDLFEVRSTNGDTNLGGDIIDHIFLNFIVTKMKDEIDVDLSDDLCAMERIREGIEKVKCELSTLPATTLNLPFVAAKEGEPQHFQCEITREEFESLIQPVLERLILPCEQALEDAKITREDIDSVLLVGGSTRIPAVTKLVKDFFGKEPSHSINPDEAVAIGAAIQAEIVTGSLQEVLLLDVTPLSLGIELQAGVFSVLIPRNSSIPTTATKRFTTVSDYQTAVQIHVLQGERKKALENRTLAHFRLTGITPAPKEVPEIEVRFLIDANGILNVSAKDVSSGSSKEIVVEEFARTSEEEVQQMIHDAESRSEEDREFLGAVQKKQQGGSLLSTFKNFIKTESDKIDPNDVETIEEMLTQLRTAIDNEEVDKIGQLDTALREIGEKYPDLFYIYRMTSKER